MDVEQTAKEFSQMHIDHARLLRRMADTLMANGAEAVLMWLSQRTDETYAVDIAEHFGLTAGRVANIIRQLEKRHFVIRKQDSSDQRRAEIHLTTSGLMYAEDCFHNLTANYVQVLEALGEEDARDWMRVIRRVIDAADRNTLSLGA